MKLPNPPEVWLGIAAPLSWSEIDRDISINEAIQSLSSEDLQRLDTKKRDLPRLEFLTGRWIANRLAAAFDACSNNSDEKKGYTLQINSLGRPFLRSEFGLPDLSISISHSEGFVAVALCSHASVGIDTQSFEWTDAMAIELRAVPDTTEQEANRSSRRIASNDRKRRRSLSKDAYRLVLSNEELDIVNVHETAVGSNVDFIRRWTLKEAVVKATGQAGLGRIASVDTTNTSPEVPEVFLGELQTKLPHRLKPCSLSWSSFSFDNQAYWTSSFQIRPKMILSLAILKTESTAEDPPAMMLIT